MQIDKDEYAKIADEIHSDSSPDGIDAKKTHILILHKLQMIEERLERIENRLKKDECRFFRPLARQKGRKGTSVPDSCSVDSPEK